jgi:CheY-like chemotaxis protein
LRLLLVDDDEINRDIVLLMLDRLDQHADAAGNGIEALAAMRAAQYDVVLMDIQMPEMDGLEATCRIRSELSEAIQPAIIAMTANVTVEDQAVFLRTGMDDVLPKPVRMRELAAVLESRGRHDGEAVGLAPEQP